MTLSETTDRTRERLTEMATELRATGGKPGTYTLAVADRVPELLDEVDELGRKLATANETVELMYQVRDRMAADIHAFRNPTSGGSTEMAGTVTIQRGLTGRCGVCGKGVHQPLGEEMGWSHYAMPVPFHQVDGVTVNEPKPAIDELPACCDGKTRRCETCGGHWEDGEPMRPCTYTCTHGKACDHAEPRAWHQHSHGHLGVNRCEWSTKAAEENPHARCAHAEQHHAHRWGQPAHWCDGTPITTPAVPEKETTS